MYFGQTSIVTSLGIDWSLLFQNAYTSHHIFLRIAFFYCRTDLRCMDNQEFRGILLRLQDRLSDNDRKRLHFFFGNDVPRRIRDDPSLGGTLSLMDSLFDQDKINEQDFTVLIKAFNEIQCLDAAKLLRCKVLSDT